MEEDLQFTHRYTLTVTEDMHRASGASPFGISIAIASGMLLKAFKKPSNRLVLSSSAKEIFDRGV
jgi:hypothetical protein